MYCPDNYDAFSQHDAEREREEKQWRSKLPECSECGEKIKSEEFYNLGGDYYCEECMDSHKVRTENYID